MSQIKLLHSGGNGVILSAPASNPAADRTLTLPGDADGTILTSNSSTGKILQVKSVTKTNAQSTSSTNTFVDITGLSIAITPTQNDSHMFIQAKVNYGGSNNAYAAFKFLRDSTAIGLSTYGTGNHVNSSFGAKVGNFSNADYDLFNAGGDFLDDRPNGTSQITYKLQYNVTAGSTPLYINRPHQTQNTSYIVAGTSSLTVMEVAA